MTTSSKKSTPRNEAAQRRAMIAAALPHMAFDGFTDTLMRRAAKEADLDMRDVARLFPNGAIDLLAAYSEDVDAEMEKRLAALKLSAMPVRQRIAAAVRTRLEILKPHKEAVRRGIAHLSLPPNIALGTRLVYRTVDAMWRAAGDVSTDFNFYTKRAILAGVYTATVMRWLTDTSEAERDTAAFLDARIEDVMRYERLKKRVREEIGKLPSLAEILARMPTPGERP